MCRWCLLRSPDVCGFVGVNLVGLGRVNVVFGMVGVTDTQLWVGGNCCESPQYSPGLQTPEKSTQINTVQCIHTVKWQ